MATPVYKPVKDSRGNTKGVVDEKGNFIPKGGTVPGTPISPDIKFAPGVPVAAKPRSGGSSPKPAAPQKETLDSSTTRQSSSGQIFIPSSTNPETGKVNPSQTIDLGTSVQTYPKTQIQKSTSPPPKTTGEIRAEKPLGPIQQIDRALQIQAQQIQKRQASGKGSVIQGSLLVGTYAAKTVFVDVPVGYFNIATNPIGFGKGLISAAVNYDKLGLALGNTLRDNPAQILGTGAGLAAVGPTYSFIYKQGRNVVVAAGKNRVPAEQVFYEPSLQAVKGEGGATFPTTRSPTESISRFAATKSEEGLLRGTHATGSNFARNAVAKGSKSPGIEDTGLYLTPKGEGSPYFLRVGKGDYSYSFSINPLSGIIKNPTVVNVGFSRIRRLPESLLRSSGFQASNEYLTSRAGTGTAFITKRSELGTRPELSQFNRGFKGTSEIEAVIPEGTLLQGAQRGGNIFQRLSGYSEYTRVAGYNVPIREYVAVGSNPLGRLTPARQALSEGDLSSIYSRASGPSYSGRLGLLPAGGTFSLSRSVRSALIGSSSSIGRMSYSSSAYDTIPPYYSNVASRASRSYFRSRGYSRGGSSFSTYSGESSIIGGSSLPPPARRGPRTYRTQRSFYPSYPGYPSYGPPVLPPNVLPPLPRTNAAPPRQRSPLFSEVPFKSLYVGSVESGIFGIKGRASKFTVESGLGIRPLRAV